MKSTIKTLYIIGNGFDLHHKLNTKYCAFGFFLKENYSTIYDHLIEYYGFSDLIASDNKSSDDILWAQFEASLALLDSDTVLEAHSDSVAYPSSPDFRDRDWNTFAIDIEMLVEELTVKLFDAFKKFILEIKYPKKVDIKKLSLNKNAIYLTFNYTDSLEQYYDIDPENILHIHGKANDDTLILGHGIDPKNFEPKAQKPPDGLSDEEYEQWSEFMSDNYDFSYELGKDQLLNYFSRSFKETSLIINDNQSFFNSLNNIQQVIILGHSLSMVDLPYITKTYKSIREGTLWTVTYYSDKEKSSHRNTLIQLNIEENNIELITINQLIE